MEDTLGVIYYGKETSYRSLNPCFNGRYSRSGQTNSSLNQTDVVLILVLMEDTLGAVKNLKVKGVNICLNPCFNGRYSRRSKLFLELYNSKS